MNWLHTHHPDVVVGTGTAIVATAATVDSHVSITQALLVIASAVASACASTYLRWRLEQAAKAATAVVTSTEEKKP